VGARRPIIQRLFSAAAAVAGRLTGPWRLRSLGIALPVAPGGWSIGYDDAEAIVRELQRFEQRRHIDVLEFGSGVSTYVILATLRARFDSYRFVSVEADPRWHEQVSRQVAKAYPNAAGSFSLVKADYRGQTFDLDEVWRSVPFPQCDVLVVDAPPDTHGDDVRLELCLRLLSRLSPRGALILHDTNRINELYAFTRLSAHFHEARRLETRKGISMFWFPKA